MKLNHPSALALLLVGLAALPLHAQSTGSATAPATAAKPAAGPVGSSSGSTD